MTIDLAALPENFLWGTATAAYPIEGAVAEGGRQPSIWDTFSHTPGKIDNGDNGDVACDHYHRWREDIALMRQLGTNAYRLSIAWPRVVPGGDGPVNAKGLAFYDELIDALLEADITPSVTLYHWDLPQVLQDRGGWPSRDTAHHFASYAAVVAERLGDRVHHWTTLNEPLCSAWIGHLEGKMAPGCTDLTAAVRASYHLLLGHGLATQAIRAAAPGAQVGIVNNLSTIHAATDRPEDHDAARRMDGHTNRWWLDPIHGRGFPSDMREVYGVELPEQPGDLETIAQPLDWLGLNYYMPIPVADDPPPPPRSSARSPASGSPAPAWTGRSTRTASRPSCSASPASTAPASCTSRRTAPPTRTSYAPTERWTTPNARTTCSATSRPAPQPPATARPWPATSPGRCWTTSSGHTATPSASASSTSTTRPRSAR